ncbi:putative 217 kDa protein Y4HQ [Sphingomonas paucimobilis]|nr:putative 217 kDa protein Y4HQ [Sphingomonas paucimobilis]
MSAIARLKITLNDVEPLVMRRIELPLTLKLDRLHTIIQTAMGWSNTHLWEFRFAGDITFGIPDPDYLSDTIDARKETLRGALEDCGGKTPTTRIATSYSNIEVRISIPTSSIPSRSPWRSTISADNGHRNRIGRPLLQPSANRAAAFDGCLLSSSLTTQHSPGQPRRIERYVKMRA